MISMPLQQNYGSDAGWSTRKSPYTKSKSFRHDIGQSVHSTKVNAMFKMGKLWSRLFGKLKIWRFHTTSSPYSEQSTYKDMLSLKKCYYYLTELTNLAFHLKTIFLKKRFVFKKKYKLLNGKWFESLMCLFLIII